MDCFVVYSPSSPVIGGSIERLTYRLALTILISAVVLCH